MCHYISDTYVPCICVTHNVGLNLSLICTYGVTYANVLFIVFFSWWSHKASPVIFNLQKRILSYRKVKELTPCLLSQCMFSWIQNSSLPSQLYHPPILGSNPKPCAYYPGALPLTYSPGITFFTFVLHCPCSSMCRRICIALKKGELTKAVLSFLL